MRASIICIFLFAALLFAVPGGNYSGTWTSDSGVNTGKVSLTLNGAGDSNLSFTYQDQEIKPAKVKATIAENQVLLVCDLYLEGLVLKTSFQGTVDGKTLSGKYETHDESGSIVDTGTWKASQE